MMNLTTADSFFDPRSINMAQFVTFTRDSNTDVQRSAMKVFDDAAGSLTMTNPNSKQHAEEITKSRDIVHNHGARDLTNSDYASKAPTQVSDGTLGSQSRTV